ncbi:hypothetical protein JKG47_04695 [Acidithiobacillus sp. MC6.1]|nr:hypothetical protein [Acidithiobacillus sp. MC6.1]
MTAMMIPSSNLSEYIIALAEKRGVRYVKTANDALADVVTRLSDDEVDTDDTEDLIVALRRANAIDGSTMVSLLGNYLDEKRNVRSI